MSSLEEFQDSPDAKRYADALRGAREGSPHALDEVISELSPMLWRVARSTGLDRQYAEDVVQTTWLALVKSVSTIETPAALPGWLVKTARRESWKLGRGQKQENTVDQEWDGLIADQPDLDEDIAERMGLAPRYHVLRRVIADLDEVCRALIQVVAYWDRPNYSQLSDALGIPRGSIGPKRGRCLAELRQRLRSDPEWKD